jgi:hypothetical protein
VRTPRRAPTDEAKRTLRRLRRLAGSEAELHRWVALHCREPAPKRGRPHAADSPLIDPHIFWPGVLAWCVTAERNGVDRPTTVRGLVRAVVMQWPAEARGGSDPDKITERLLKKLKAYEQDDPRHAAHSRLRAREHGKASERLLEESKARGQDGQGR